MTPQELKTSILQSALQGKLVPQIDDEGTGAAEILKMSQDKQRLIKAKMIKKEKELGDVEETDKPYDVPDSWGWVKVGNVGSWSAGATPSRSNPDYYGGDIPWLKTGDLNDGYVASVPEFISQLALEKTSVRLNPVGSVLMAMYGATIGKLAILEVPMTTNQACCACIPYEGIYNKYLFYFLMGNRSNFIKMGEGGAQPNISKDKIVNYPIAVPPLEEQKRIVAKIEELLPYIDRYGEAFTKLEEFNKRFPVDMQKSILQTAIQGKLVEQRPEEGTGEELFAEICKTKDRLIAEKIIKKEKPFAEITDEEKPYEIPDNWVWVRFGNLGSYKKGPFGSALTKSMFVPKGNGAIKVYEQKNAIQKSAELGDYYITREYFEEKMTGFEVFPGDVIVSCAGTIGETYVMPDEFEQGIINQALMRMKLYEPIYVPYFLLYFDFVLKRDARSSSKGSAIKNIPPFEVLKNYLVPLPPLEEQKRIVKRVEKILPLCDRLK